MMTFITLIGFAVFQVLVFISCERNPLLATCEVSRTASVSWNHGKT
jgi:hypothetical protein